MNGMLKYILKELGFQPIAEIHRGVAVCGTRNNKGSIWIFESKDPQYDLQLCGNTKFILAEPDCLKRIKNAVIYCTENKERHSGCLECPYRIDLKKDPSKP